MEFLRQDDKRLRLKSEEVLSLEEAKSVGRYLTSKFNELDGKVLGLAAPQLGILKRVVLIRKHGKPDIIVNPKIEFTLLGRRKSMEGCESTGGKKNQYIVSRPNLALVTWTDLTGRKHCRLYGYKKMRVFEHEVDHLNGILIDRGVKVC